MFLSRSYFLLNSHEHPTDEDAIDATFLEKSEGKREKIVENMKEIDKPIKKYRFFSRPNPTFALFFSPFFPPSGK